MMLHPYPSERRATLHPNPAGIDGSVLIESIVGIGILALVITMVGSGHQAALRAHEHLSTRSEAIRTVEAHLEWAAASPIAGDVPEVLSDLTPPSVHRDDPEDRAACAATPWGADGGLRVGIAYDTPADHASAELEGRGPRSGERILRVRLRDPALVRGMDVAVSVDGAGATEVRSDGSGCFELVGLPPGTHRIGLTADGTTLVDRTHVLLDERPFTIDLLEQDVAVTLDAAPAALVTVVAVADGARTPDAVGPGVLGWSVRDDDARVVSALGAERAIHPGRVTVVVSACANPAAHGSQRTYELAPGERSERSVPLAVVAVDGVAGRSDATLEVLRSESCADGTGWRPSLRWIGGLRDGMRIALPAGGWEGRLLSATGTPLTPMVTIEAGGTERRVRLP